METQTLLGDRYRVRGVLGEGTMSVVLLATDLRLDRDVAVKVLRTTLLTDPVAVARFRREADDACALDHPGIVGVYDTGENDAGAGPVPFMVVEFVDGESLQAALERDDPLSASRALQITAGILDALAFAHGHGVVHRSLSPATVMLERSGVAKVMDFGVGVVALHAPGTGRHARPDAIRGMQYASPEQVVGAPLDARSDVYSAGCLLHHMLTGSPLFDEESRPAPARDQLAAAPPAPHPVRPGVPAELEAIVRTATRTAPLDRFQTATLMRAAVHAALTRQLLPAVGPAGTAPSETQTLSAPVTPKSPSRLTPPLLAPLLLAPPLLAPPLLTSGMLGATPGPPPDVGEDDPDPGPRSRKGWARNVLFAVCALLLVIAGMLTAAVLTAPAPPSLVAVPDLSGKTVQQATEILRGHGLVIGTVGRVESPDPLKGKVVDQRPSGRTQVGQQTPVSLEIGRGVTVVSVPDLIGTTATQARARVNSVKLGYAETRKPSSDPDKGKVIAQDVTPRTQVRPGRKVTVTIGTGLNLVAVPDGLVGTTIDRARTLLRSAGLTMVAQQGDGTAPVNQVIDTDQPAGRNIPQGTPVIVTVSNNALMVMPALSGRPKDAVAILRSLSWAGDLGSLAVSAKPTPNAAAVGTIVGQDPAPGAAVRKIGTPVRVAIGVRQLIMPSVTGRTQQQALRALTRAGATNVSFTDAGAGPGRRSGRVATQSIPAGTPVAVDTPLVVGVFTR